MRFYWPIAKVDAEQRMVWGYASTEAEDDQGETVSRQALAAALDDYIRFANIREMHQPSAVGVAKEAAVDDKGLYLGAKIVDGDAWQKVVEGVYKGFSIGGRVTARDPTDRRLITALRLTEISVVDRPANPEAVFDCWKLSSGATAGGSMATIAATTGAPMQIWDCGVAGHRHLAKAEAVRCLEGEERTGAAAGGQNENAAGSGDDPYGEVDYADPGYRPDAKQRYPIDTERHIRAAWAFIHLPGNARHYTAGQLERIKARIVAAWQEKIDRDGPPAAAAEPRRAAAPTGKDGVDNPSPAQRLAAIIAELRELWAVVAVDGDDCDGAEFGALARAAGLKKHAESDLRPLASGLAKLAGEITPRLDALQKRVEEIARTPLPPQTIARGFAGISKREDAGETIPPAEDIVAALARMSEEERTLTLIKAAHQNPIAPVGRPAGFAMR
jgi:phage head maturation protease